MLRHAEEWLESPPLRAYPLPTGSSPGGSCSSSHQGDRSLNPGEKKSRISLAAVDDKAEALKLLDQQFMLQAVECESILLKRKVKWLLFQRIQSVNQLMGFISFSSNQQMFHQVFYVTSLLRRFQKLYPIPR